MEFLLCVSCGEFVKARDAGDAWEPLVDACPACGGTEFEEPDTGSGVRRED